MKHEPASRFARLDDNALLARRNEIVDRISEVSGKVMDGVHQWTRFDPNIQAERSGTRVTGKAGRAIGRVKDDGRILDEIDRELAERGWTGDEVAVEYERHYETQERQALDAESGDASFRVEDDEVVIAPVVAPKRSGKRDRLSWVPKMAALAAQYRLMGIL